MLLQYYVDREICPNNTDTFQLYKRIDCQNWIIALDIEFYEFFPQWRIAVLEARGSCSQNTLLEILASQTSYLSSRKGKLGQKNDAVLLLLKNKM